ncbi:diguanylate cyclase [Microvirga arabica]|uniref:diguanylate cyclase n=1 Tax=Microvirga arabica TaxID=1128671 RepID=A0ABV6YDM9_9HYPH
MLALNGSDFLRIAIFSGALGFAVFCASYSLLVWRKRNKGRGYQPSWLRRIAYASLTFGAIGVLTAWGFSELEKREGIAGGSDLFVVHARRDNTVLNLTSRDAAEAGEVIAEYVPLANQTQLAVKDIQQAQAQARKEAIRVQSLPVDQGLVQRELQIRTQITQAEGFLLELQKSRGETEKARAAILTEWTREKTRLEGEIASTEKSLSAALSQLEIARTAQQQAADAFKKQIITQPVYDMRRSNFISAEREVNTQQAALSSLRARSQALEERFRQSDIALGQQLVQIDENAIKFSASLESYKAQLTESERLLDEDRARARALVEREIEAADLETSIAAAEKERSIETTQLKAPFSGHIVFRHPTPGLAADGAPVLALSSGTGFLARIRLPRAEADELASDSQPVPLMLDSPVLRDVISAKFVRFEPVPLMKDQVAAFFDCTLPADVIASLGNSAEPVKVRLLWKPSLLRNTGAQASAAVALLGVLGLLFSGTRAKQEAQADRAAGNLPGTLAEPQSLSDAATPIPSEPAGGQISASAIVDIRSRKPLVQHRGELVPKDSVTGLIDRDQFLGIAEDEVKNASAAGIPLTVVILRINQLRQANTIYGRKVGDAILKDLAELCRGSRDRDLSARWSGEEFVVLLPETDLPGAEVVAERLRLRASQLRVGDLPHIQSSISVGVANVLSGETTVMPALERAIRQAEEDARGTHVAPITA